MYDAIIIGARCAGSPTAMLLARKGYRVLVVDKATFPSDLAMSTHFIHQPGVARLKRWGLLDKIRNSNCPAIAHYTFDVGAFALTGCPPPAEDVTEAYPPRRIVLDKILVDAAVEAGAEVREGFVVQALTSDSEGVTGIQGRTPNGTTVTEQAQIVIGADGMNSLVARVVQAPQYQSRPPLQGTYFTYWSGVPMEGIEIYPRDYRCIYGWPTNDNLTLIGANWAIRDFSGVHADIEGNYFKVLEAAAPGLAEQVHSGKREGRWVGGAIENFFRKPYGPGWALVGDAGYKKDPGTAAGITDAFRDTELLVQALDEGFSGDRPLDEALAHYEQQRNEVALPIYEFICQTVTFEPPTADQLQLFAALRDNQPDTNRFFGLMAQTTSPLSSSRQRTSSAL